MSSSFIRSQLERKRQQRVDADKRAGEYRAKDADHRDRASKAMEAANRSSSPSTISMRIREAQRHDRQSNDAAKEAARWQKRSAEYGREEVRLQARLADEENRERLALDRKLTRDREASERSAASQRAEVLARLEATESSVASLRAPKPEPLRILILAAAPRGDLRLAREQTRIRKAVEASLHRDLVEFDTRGSASAEDLFDGVTKFRPHVVHFSGHSNEDQVFLEQDVDPEHDGVGMSADQFARVLGAVDQPPLLVVMNSCNSAPQAVRLAESVVPFAIGMSDSIDDTDAINYAARFYASIANGQSIAAAHDLAKLDLERLGVSGWVLPTLAYGPDADPRDAILVLPPTS